MTKIKVTKVKSAINRPLTQKRTLESLGLKKIGQTVEHDNTPSIIGMVNKIKHLVSVEEMSKQFVLIANRISKKRITSYTN